LFDEGGNVGRRELRPDETVAQTVEVEKVGE
jgi:hypothetical protein